MKKYRLNIIKFTFEFIFVFCAIFLLSSTTVDNSTLAVSMNDNLAKSINKDVIQATQRELYEEGIYNAKYTFVGELTGYAGNCKLCTGYLACPPRTNVLKKGIYYEDKTYGKLRIVASSKKYPCGTILRFNVPKLSDEPMMAIVLDRGVSGNVIDLLTESESYAIKYVGRVRNLEFEVLRQGWK